MKEEATLELLQRIGSAVCDHVYRSLKNQHTEQLSAVVEDAEEDTIYAIDREVEDLILPILLQEAEALGGIYLIAEGMGSSGKVLLPQGITEKDAKIRIMMDPIDGTRGIMYNKRSAFFLAAAAPNRPGDMYLSDLTLAIMTELPTAKAYLSDSFFAIRGQGTRGFQRNLIDNSTQTIAPSPSRASSILGGFAQIARFFPPGKSILADIEEELILNLGNIEPGKALVFEDQYISSGGQLYELLSGHDRFIADLRPALYRQLERSGTVTGLCCHPYDVCATLIGEEVGLEITDLNGRPLDVPLNLTYPVNWIGYANSRIRQEVEPVLQKILKKVNWIV